MNRSDHLSTDVEHDLADFLGEGVEVVEDEDGGRELALVLRVHSLHEQLGGRRNDALAQRLEVARLRLHHLHEMQAGMQRHDLVDLPEVQRAPGELGDVHELDDGGGARHLGSQLFDQGEEDQEASC